MHMYIFLKWRMVGGESGGGGNRRVCVCDDAAIYFLTYGGNGLRHMGKRGCVEEKKRDAAQSTHTHTSITLTCYACGEEARSTAQVYVCVCSQTKHRTLFISFFCLFLLGLGRRKRIELSVADGFLMTHQTLV